MKIPSYKVPGFFRKSKCSSKKITIMFHIHASKLIKFPPNIKKYYKYLHIEHIRTYETILAQLTIKSQAKVKKNTEEFIIPTLISQEVPY